MCVWIYVCIYLCMCVYEYTFMHVCMFVCVIPWGEFAHLISSVGCSRSSLSGHSAFCSVAPSKHLRLIHPDL